MSGQDDTLTPDEASRVWDLLSERVEQFLAAWKNAESPPDMASLLPEQPAALRRFVLVELVKVDLEERWRNPAWHKLLEVYLDEFPELRAQLPCDLIYEEFHIRRQAGEHVDVEHYCERFPSVAAQLRRLLDTESTRVTTSSAGMQRAGDFELKDSVDDFDLLSSLGKGAFANVYLARQRSLGRLVALKVSADRGSEPQMLAQLDHPHIVRVFDQRLIPEKRMRLLYMQYVPGGTLQGVIDKVRKVPPALRRGSLVLEVIDAALSSRGESPPTDSRTRSRLARLSWPQAVCWLGARVADALDYAHAHGVLHRDLKPANVLLAAEGSPKLADFNISFSSKVEGTTPAAYFGGSLGYMSPEQLEACNVEHDRRPEDLDGRSDVYSLGLVLWEMLSGERPFADDRMVDLSPATLDRMAARRRAGVDRQAVARLPVDCPDGLTETLQTCLAPNVENRFATAGALARQLDLCLQPMVQRLLRPRSRAWSSRLRRWPILPILAAGILPNAICSLLAIAYNYPEIVKRFGEPANRLFTFQVLVINPVSYAIGVTFLLALAWPVIAAVRRRSFGQELDPAVTPRLRLRCLKLGDFVALVSAVLWLISGVVFPVWLNRAVQHAGGLEFHDYIHFLASEFLCGLLSATMSFFLVTLVEIRVCCPVLLDSSRDDEATVDALGRLGTRTTWYMSLAFASVPLALLLISLLQTRSPLVLPVLALVGLVDSAVAVWITRQIQRDVLALQYAASAEARALLPADSSDSFWTATR